MKQLPPAVIALIAVVAISIAFAMGRSSTPQLPPPPPSNTPLPVPSAAAIAVVTAVPLPNGPSFAEADSKMSDNVNAWTQAQKDAYWLSITGTRVQWAGEVVEVDSTGTGALTLKCNPNTWSSDTHVTLDGTQTSTLSTLNKGQQVRFTGILNGHGLTGYYIVNGHIN